MNESTNHSLHPRQSLLQENRSIPIVLKLKHMGSTQFENMYNKQAVP